MTIESFRLWFCGLYNSILSGFLRNLPDFQCSVPDTFKILACPELYLFRYNQAYSALLRHINAYWGTIKGYPGFFRHIQHTVWPLHIHNFSIFRSLAYLESQAYSKFCETLSRHIQNPAIVRRVYSGINQPFSGIFRTFCQTCIWRNLEYWESWNIERPSIIASRRLFRKLSHLRK